MIDLVEFTEMLTTKACNPFELARGIMAARGLSGRPADLKALEPYFAAYARRYCAHGAFVDRVIVNLYTSDSVITGADIAQWARDATPPPAPPIQRDYRWLTIDSIAPDARSAVASLALSLPTRDDANIGWLSVLGIEAERRIYGPAIREVFS